MDAEFLLITGRSATGHCCQLCSFVDPLLDYCWLSQIWIVYGNNGEEAVNSWRRWLHFDFTSTVNYCWSFCGQLLPQIVTLSSDKSGEDQVADFRVVCKNSLTLHSSRQTQRHWRLVSREEMAGWMLWPQVVWYDHWCFLIFIDALPCQNRCLSVIFVEFHKGNWWIQRSTPLQQHFPRMITLVSIQPIKNCGQ